MKKTFLILIFLVIFCPSLAFSDLCENYNFQSERFEEFRVILAQSFPFNMIQFGYETLDGLSNVSAVSPANISFVIFGIQITPLSFMSSGVFDVIFQAIRIIMLGILCMSVVKHVLEVIL